MKLSVIHNPERTSDRFKAVERTLVWCHQDTEALPYHLLDISTDGLSFRYLGKAIAPESLARISLYHERELIVSDLPIEPVSDLIMEEAFVPVRRASVFFKTLSDEQRSKLDYFIQNFTLAE